jgi:hypothetical protein
MAEVRTRLKVLSDRSFEDFELSANQTGCFYCAIALQTFLLFEIVVANMKVDLLLYPNSPTEMHSMPKEGQSEVLEIYPCASKYNPTIATSLVVLIEYRRLSKYRAIMVTSS